MVAEFRADVSAHISTPPIVRIVDELSARSEVFKRYWHERLVLEREGGKRTFNHPADGLLSFEQVSFAQSGHPDLKLAVLLPQEPSAAGAATSRTTESVFG